MHLPTKVRRRHNLTPLSSGLSGMLKLSFRAENGIGAITTSPSGRDVALASRSGLFIVDLQEPYSPPRHLSLRIPWEVSASQWCTHPDHQNWVVSTANQKLVVWNLALPSHRAIEHMLHGHSRAITDVSFNRLSPDLLATCSIDTFIHVWDMRDPVRPSMSFADFNGGASQVQWSKTQPHLLASTHDSRLLLWDSRKNNIPLNEVYAHAGRVNAVEFDGTSSNRLVTASIDRTVKVWNLKSLKKGGEQEPRSTYTTNFPIWKCRFLPDGGNGAIVIPMRGGENNALLCDFSIPGTCDLEVVQSFSRHKAPIKDVTIRRDGNGYDLITWGADQQLCVFSIDEDSLNSVDVPAALPQIPPRDYSYRTNPTDNRFKSAAGQGFFGLRDRIERYVDSKDAEGRQHIDWIAGVQIGGGDGTAPEPQFSSDGLAYGAELERTPAGDITREFTAVSNKFPKVVFEKIDIACGTCTLTIRGPWGKSENQLVILRVSITFPPDYPFVPLQISIEDDLNSDPQKLAQVENDLSNSCQILAEHGKPALEYSLRILMGEKVSIDSVDYQQEDPATFDDFNLVAYPSSSEDEYGGREELSHDDHYHDDMDLGKVGTDEFIGFGPKPLLDTTPLPRTCGAVWANNGSLVISINRRNDEKSPEINVYSIDKLLAGEESDESDDSFDSFDTDYSFHARNMNWHSRMPVRMRNWRDRDGLFTGGNNHNNSHAEDARSEHSVKESRIVKIVDLNYLLPSRSDVAAEYRLDITPENLSEVAEYNAKVADKFGLKEERYIWRLVKCYAPPASKKPDEKPSIHWFGHPLYEQLRGSLIPYLWKKQNMPMAIALDAVFAALSQPLLDQSTRFHVDASGRPKAFTPFYETKLDFMLENNSLGSEYPLMKPQKQLTDRPHRYSLRSMAHSGGPSVPGQFKSSTDLIHMGMDDLHRLSVSGLPSTSHSTMASPSVATPKSLTPEGGQDFDEFSLTIRYSDPIDTDGDFVLASKGLNPYIGDYLAREGEVMRERREIYAKILYAWGLYIKRLELLNVPYPILAGEDAMEEGDYDNGEEFMIDVKLAGRRSTHNPKHAQKPVCAYCREIVTTAFCACLKCNHMVHTECLVKWSGYASEYECPSGCGCACYIKGAVG